MITRLQKLRRPLAATALFVTALPLSLMMVDSYFGLASVLFPPALVVAAVFTLATRERERRAWWFGFAVTLATCLPFCPLAFEWLASGAIFLRDTFPTLSPRIVEPSLIIAVVVCPFLTACALAIGGGSLTRCLARRPQAADAVDAPDGPHWQFSLREFLVAIGAVAFLFAWIGGQMRSWHGLEATNQSAFLDRFKGSFSSGEAMLLAEPEVLEQQRTLMPEYRSMQFRPPGINEYRIIAPIRRGEDELWAVWSYTCVEEVQTNSDFVQYLGEYICKFAYAEAPQKRLLPSFPLPAKRHIEGAWEMVDGVPLTAGPSATVLAATSPSPAGQPLTLSATAPRGTICELHVFPMSLTTTPLKPMQPDKKGVVRWSWSINPTYVGNLNYEIRCIQRHGASRRQMVSTTRGTIQITR